MASDDGAAPSTRRALRLIGNAIAVILLAILGVYTFVRANHVQIHPDPQSVTSVAAAEPQQKWAAAVGRGRELARQAAVDLNVPGISVAVGVDGEVVWAESFGWSNIADRVPLAPSMRFRIGHASKPVTSAGVGILLERGK